jgi:pimeloyl-ACP methyl ester carboxylesterase
MSEFSSLREVAAELGLPSQAIPPVTRSEAHGISIVRWGEAEPEVVFLHGGGQNARTWDLVALRLGRPALAIDLPGHGHSAWRDDHDYGPMTNAATIAGVLEKQIDVVGMSLGGLTAIRLAATRPELVRRLVLVDVTPGSPAAAAALPPAQRGAVALTSGPRTYPTLDAMVEAAVAASPRRPASAVRRGVVHNTQQLPDGTWAWRYDRNLGGAAASSDRLWDDLASLAMPTLLVKGGESGFVTADHLNEATRRLPALKVEVVGDSGHSVQSDQPVELATLLQDFLTRGATTP